MSPKQWFALLLLYILYLLFGALIFQALESERDYQTKLEQFMGEKELLRLTIETAEQYENETDREAFLTYVFKVQDVKGSIFPEDFNITANFTANFTAQGRTNDSTTEEGEEFVVHNWDLWNAFYFSFITVTTIGYGNVSPRTRWGQQFCVLFSLFGMPLNTMVFVSLSTFYKNFIMTEEDQNGAQGRTTQSVLVRAAMYLLPGLVIFLIVPAVIFNQIEGWDFFESFYFTFISLTTIGFGDMVPGALDTTSAWYVVYNGFIMVWTMLGLSYIIMVLSFLLIAFTSKKVRKIEKITRQRLMRVSKLLQIVAQQNRNRIYLKAIKNKKASQRGIDNPTFAIAEEEGGNRNATEITIPRRNSFDESKLPEHRRTSIKGEPSKPAEVLESVKSDTGTTVKKETINELIAAVEDLLENEFQGTEDANKTNEDRQAEASQSNEVSLVRRISQSIKISPSKILSHSNEDSESAENPKSNDVSLVRKISKSIKILPGRRSSLSNEASGSSRDPQSNETSQSTEKPQSNEASLVRKISKSFKILPGMKKTLSNEASGSTGDSHSNDDFPSARDPQTNEASQTAETPKSNEVSLISKISHSMKMLPRIRNSLSNEASQSTESPQDKEASLVRKISQSMRVSSGKNTCFSNEAYEHSEDPQNKEITLTRKISQSMRISSNIKSSEPDEVSPIAKVCIISEVSPAKNDPLASEDHPIESRAQATSQRAETVQSDSKNEEIKEFTNPV